MIFKPEKMERGRGQLLQRFRPDETFDHEGHFIAQVTDFRRDRARDDEIPRARLIEEGIRYVRRWRAGGRVAQRLDAAPSFPADTAPESMYDVVVPSGVYYAYYPLSVTCGSSTCRRVYELHRAPEPGQQIEQCPRCGHDPSFQVQYVLVHGCGFIMPFRPPRQCSNGCTEGFRLDTKASRFRDFRWLCIHCGSAIEVREICSNQQCTVNPKLMHPEVHTSGQAYVQHNVRVVNPPPASDRAPIHTIEYRLGIIARWLGVCTDDEFRSLTSGRGSEMAPEVRFLIEQMREVDPARAEEMERRFAPLGANHLRERIAALIGPAVAADDASVGALASQLETYEYTMRGDALELAKLRTTASSESRRILYDRYPLVLQRAGLDPSKLVLVSEFPVIELAVGYSRSGYAPATADLRPYRTARTRGQATKTAFYAHPQKTEALVFALERTRLRRWLDANRLAPAAETGGPEGVVTWFARYLSRRGDAIEWIDYNESDPAPEDRAGDAVVRLIHSMSHQFIRALSVDSGYMETSLSEYFFPYHLCFAVYPRANTEFVMGGLRTVLEQNLDEVVMRALENDFCLYDPNCMQAARGADHGCLFLPETACSFRDRNVQLSRWELFGAPNGERIGYWDPVLDG